MGPRRRTISSGPESDFPAEQTIQRINRANDRAITVASLAASATLLKMTVCEGRFQAFRNLIPSLETKSQTGAHS